MNCDYSDTLDKVCTDMVDDNINMSVPWFLMAAYAYYLMDDPIISDAKFDRLCRRMIESWNEIEHHHKDLISLDDLKARSYMGAYPLRIKGAIKHLKEAYFGKPKRL